MKNIVLIFSYSYLFKNKHTNISKMINICFTSIFLATLLLTLSLFIMSGFEEITKEKLKNMNPDITLQSYGQDLNFEKIAPILQEFKEIRSISPVNIQYGILEKHNKIKLDKVLLIKGVMPKTEALTTNINKLIKVPNEPLEKLITNHKVIVGKKFSISENLNVGNKFNIVFANTNSSSKSKINFDTIEVEISGLFETGIDELDNNLIICNLNLTNKIFNKTSISQINIKLKDNINEKDIKQKLINYFGIEAYSWKDLNPAIVSALKLEKYLTFIILSFLVFIASMNLISLVYMLITRKRKEIAILFTLGMPLKNIKRIFLLTTLFISLIASASGTFIAIILAKLIQINKIPIPDAYFVSYLPAEINLAIIPIIIITSLLLTIIATISPINSLKEMNIAKILRFE